MAETGKKIIITVLCVILMCGAVLSAVMYAEGYFDISFIDRDSPENEERPKDDTTAPDTAQEDTQTDTPDIVIPQEDEIIIPDAYEYLNSGYTVSGDMYDKDVHIIARLPINITNNYTSGTVMKPHTSVSIGLDGVKRDYHYSMTEQPLYTAELYMGYIIVSENGISTVYNTSLEKILSTPTKDLGNFVYMTDKDGYPVFEKNGEYFKVQNGTLVKTEAVDMGLYYNGVINEDASLFATKADGGIIYKDENGNTVFTAEGQKGYGSSEGYCMTVDGESVYFYNDSGVKKIKKFFDVGQKDIYGKGSVYFDSGYVMVRNIVINHKNKVTEDYETLINTSGKEYALPSNTSLISYSDQRLLLERDGKYGFYALRNDWITDVEYTYATPYCEGLAVVGDKDGKKGVIDINGDTVIPFEYSHITECANGVFMAYSETDGWSVLVKIK